MSEGYSFIEGERVRLWDGKMYPRACVEQEMAGLSDYANGHDTLTETSPSRLGASIARTGLMYLCIGIAFGALFFISSGNLIISIVIAMFLLIVVAAFDVIPFFWIAQRVRRTTSVNNGYVIFRLGRQNVRLPLESFQWYRGRSRHDTLLKLSAYPNIRTLVLVTRLKFRWFPVVRHKIACGFTPEMRTRWAAFLTLAGVPYGRRGVDVNLVANIQNEPDHGDSEVTCDDSETGR